MSQLAPGRTHDVEMLLRRRAKAKPHTSTWHAVQLKIEDLVEEGKCPYIREERGRLVRAARASDHTEVEKISLLIDHHVRYKHRQRYMRGWLKKG